MDRSRLLDQHKRAVLTFLVHLGAISRHAKVPARVSAYHPYSTGRPTSRHTSAGSRGRGRGAKTYGLDLRAANKASASATPAPPVVQSPKDMEKEVGEVSPPPQAQEVKAQIVEESWVKKTSKGGNMSLMTAEKRSVIENTIGIED